MSFHDEGSSTRPARWSCSLDDTEVHVHHGNDAIWEVRSLGDAGMGVLALCGTFLGRGTRGVSVFGVTKC